MTVSAPPRPPRLDDPVSREEVEALVEALIEEARQRARRRRRRNGAVVTLVALVGVALFAVLGRSAQSQSASPALTSRSSLATGTASSKIAFTSQPRFGPQARSNGLYVVNPDGSGKRLLTPTAWLTTPAWSPDGRKIAFVGGGSGNVFVIDVDGSGERRLTRNAAAPSWSPDGQRIAFLRSGARYSARWEVHVMNADGSGERKLTRGAALASPAWSPDGGKIALVSRRAGNNEIHLMNADGSGERNLTRGTAYDGDPVWSPDGRKIAFVRTFDVYVMNADGSGQRNLTRSAARDFAPAWSPDGQRIAFESRLGRRRYGAHHCSKCGRASIFEVYVMDADGSGRRRLTRTGAHPIWSPDGRKIAFVSRRDGNAEIYVVNADGSGQRNLTRNRLGDEASHAWSPGQK